MLISGVVSHKKLIAKPKNTAFKWCYEFDVTNKKCVIYTNKLLDINDEDYVILSGKDLGKYLWPRVFFNTKTQKYGFQNYFFDIFTLLISIAFLIRDGFDYRNFGAYIILLLFLGSFFRVSLIIISFFQVSKKLKNNQKLVL